VAQCYLLCEEGAHSRGGAKGAYLRPEEVEASGGTVDSPIDVVGDGFSPRQMQHGQHPLHLELRLLVACQQYVTRDLDDPHVLLRRSNEGDTTCVMSPAEACRSTTCVGRRIFVKTVIAISRFLLPRKEGACTHGS
jgi:hypothetical protein